MHKIKEFFRAIKNLIDWFPVVWKDRQWDHYFIYVILRKKLQLMEKFFNSKNAVSMESEATAKDMKHCIEILDRLINQDYMEVALQPFYKKHPDYDWTMDRHFVPAEDHPGLVEWINNDPSEIQEEMQECYRNSGKMEQDDLDELFKFLRLHIEEFWD
jgi:hypothetical protein